tara:strand:+ start:105 stop:545 length:441 start_codon:yes stop_codon:yes gene_type:complete
LVKHAPGAPGLRFFGLGSNFKPMNGIQKLKNLFERNAFWARKRSINSLKVMLSHSDVIVSIWTDRNIIAFGRATTDRSFRATLWDVVVDKEYQAHGLGKLVVESILENSLIAKAEKIYLMTTNCTDFYESLNFQKESKQTLMFYNR